MISLNNLSDNEDNKFYYYNFLNKNKTQNAGTKTIPINYNFIVGYKVYIYNIQATSVPVTTVTALLHKKDTSENSDYNYSDFSIYKNSDGQFYSDAIYYNGGTANIEEFGICKQVSTTGEDIRAICSKVSGTINTEARDIKSKGYMNAENMKDVTSLIGKLTFCMPHLHNSFNENYGVNIHTAADGQNLNISNYLGEIRFIRPDSNGSIQNYKEWGDLKIYDEADATYTEKDHSRGIAVSNEYFTNPKFNLVLNTQKSLEQNSEFISTINYNPIEGRQLLQDLHISDKNNSSDIYSTVWITNNKHWAWYKGANSRTEYLFNNREFSGLTAEELPEFNKRLLRTMKGIYAYNPDYDTMSVNIGNVLIGNSEPKFISNVISKNAVLNLNGKTFNDYVGLGGNSEKSGISFSKYFELLNNYSNIIIKNNDGFLPQINFQENLRYCGGEENYLVT